MTGKSILKGLIRHINEGKYVRRPCHYLERNRDGRTCRYCAMAYLDKRPDIDSCMFNSILGLLREAAQICGYETSNMFGTFSGAKMRKCAEFALEYLVDR